MKLLPNFIYLLPIVCFSQIQTKEINGQKYFVSTTKYREPNSCHDHFSFNDSVPDGKYLIYYDDDTTKIKGIIEIINFKEKYVTVFREDSSYEVISPLDSVWKEYDNKGRIYEESYMYNGEFIVINLWDTLGNKMVSNGNGKFGFYYENGNKLSEGEILNGKHENQYRFWYENGHLMEEGNYRNGKKIGIWNTYYENGDKNKSENFGNE